MSHPVIVPPPPPRTRSILKTTYFRVNTQSQQRRTNLTQSNLFKPCAESGRGRRSDKRKQRRRVGARRTPSNQAHFVFGRQHVPSASRRRRRRRRWDERGGGGIGTGGGGGVVDHALGAARHVGATAGDEQSEGSNQGIRERGCFRSCLFPSPGVCACIEC